MDCTKNIGFDQKKEQSQEKRKLSAIPKNKYYVATKCREAKKIWTKDVAEDIEDKILKGKMDSAYNIVKFILFQNRIKSSVVKIKRGELLIDTEDISDRWK